MKSFKTIISCATALLAATMISCNKENPMQDNGQDNIPASETISVCVDGLLGEYAQENDTKASLSGAIRMKWAAGDKVYAYDATQCLGELTVSLKNGIDYFAVLSGNSLKTPVDGTTKVTLVYSNIFTEAPAIADGKIKIDLSEQTASTKADNMPFVAYGTLDYSVGTTEISNQIADFSFATSLMRLNCTELEPETAIGTTILTGMGSECLLNVTEDGVSVGQGKIGRINLELSGISASANGAQTIYAALAKTGTSEEQGLFLYQKNKSYFLFKSRARNEGMLFNVICQMSDKFVFTVKNGPENPVKTIIFSPGNLYFDGTNWGFERYQYDFRTYEGKGSCINGEYSKNSGTPTGNWGLFGWVGNSSDVFTKAPEIYGVATSETNSDYGTVAGENLKADWGTTIDAKGTWRILTNPEWTYLFNSRIDALEKCGFATVNGVPGLILLPDVTFFDPAENTSAKAREKKFLPGYFNVGWDSNIYSADGWAAMEVEGAVFLPAAGTRAGSTVSSIGDLGFYWTSSSIESSNTRVFGVDFVNDGYLLYNIADRYNGSSVRLVTEVE